MSLIKLLLGKNIKIPKLDSFKNVLFVGPHPDDIEFGCGGTVSRLKEKGAHIHFLIVTDGASGTKNKEDDPMILKKTREEESINSAKYLGAETIDFLGLPDGGDYSTNEAIKLIAPYVLKYQPEIIYAPDPNLKTECHADHIKTGEAVREIMQIIGYPHALERHSIDISNYNDFPRDIFLAQYFTDSPNKRQKISKKNWKEKEEALKMHVSQADNALPLLITYFKYKAIESGLKHFKGRCEDFKVYHPLMQHVYSEGF